MSEPEKQGNEDKEQEEERKNWGWGVGCGTILLLVGGAITLGSYISASPGESYYIYWGMMVVGALAIIGGLMMKRRK